MKMKLRDAFTDPLLDVMNFLSEVVRDYPDAISFATGSSVESLFDVQAAIDAVETYVAHHARITGLPEAAIRSDLGQYNRTNGVINELIAEQLARDEDIHVDPRSIMVTSGCQEAMAIVMLGLFEPGDVLLTIDPTYIGITGLARFLNVPVVPVPAAEDGLDPTTLRHVVEDVRQQGMRARALYNIPDFNNPLGTAMSVEHRRELLQIAREHELLVLEDNPYGMFAFDGGRAPTLKALDEYQDVIYLGTFAKTLFPSLRVGFLVADQAVSGTDDPLAVVLSKVKSMTTVNTSALVQAMVGGLLLQSGCSLQPIVESKLDFYRRNRDRMLSRLADEFGGSLSESVQWNHPSGGFFLTLTLPFDFDDRMFHQCASRYGVLCCPMSYFSLSGRRANQVRLSYCYVQPEDIDEGVARLGQFIRDQISYPDRASIS